VERTYEKSRIDCCTPRSGVPGRSDPTGGVGPVIELRDHAARIKQQRRQRHALHSALRGRMASRRAVQLTGVLAPSTRLINPTMLVGVECQW
jgi:hypothetical protein